MLQSYNLPSKRADQELLKKQNELTILHKSLLNREPVLMPTSVKKCERFINRLNKYFNLV